MPGNTESILYDVNGDPLAVDDGIPIPAGTPMLIAGGSDGTNSRYIKVDSSGNQMIVGLGTAGSPSGGVISIQGVASGTPIPISGNITASNASVSDNDLAIPAFSTLIGGSDGTNLRPVRIFDADTGGGTQWVLGVGLRKFAGGGSVEFGTSTDPIRTDPTGTTTQPISGTVTANQGGSWTVAGTGNFTVVQSTASNLRAQLASETNTGTAVPTTAVQMGGSDGTNLRPFFTDSSGRQIVIGAAADGAAVTGNPVLIGGSDGTNARTIRTATDGTVRVDPTGTTTQPISGTVTANAGSGTFTVSGTVTANVGTTGGLALDTTLAKLTIAQSAALGSNTQALVGGSVTTAAPSYTTGNINPLSLTTAGALRTDGSGVTQPVSGTVTANQGTSPWVSNITQFGSSNVVTGTGASGSGIPRVTVANDSNILATQSGTWTVQQGTPPWSVAGTAADGAAVSGNPVRIGGSDGTNTQDILTDTSGRQQIVGAAADGAAVAGNPVLMAGQDGTNAQSILTDTTGRLSIVGAAADGAAVAGNPVLVGGYDGTNAQTILTDTSGRIITTTAAEAAAPGFSFGDVALSSVTTSVVRRTTYNEQTTNAQRSISSANVNDTSAGTGARQVKITYYDSTGAGPSTETVTLNGTSAVNTVSSTICFIEKMEVVSVGSGGSNAGIITLFVSTAGGGGTLGTIAATDNRTYWSHHYVPTGKTNFITSLSVVVNGGGALFFIRAKTIGVSTAPDIQISDYVRSATQSGTSTRPYGTPIQTVGPARLLMYVTTEANTSLTYRGAFDYYDE